jgi:integrase
VIQKRIGRRAARNATIALAKRGEAFGVFLPPPLPGARTVPIASVLREHLRTHRLRSGRAEGLVFGRSATTPFNHSSVVRRAATAWKNAQPTPLEPIGLHECRHTFASLMIAAGVNAKALSTYLGHSSIQITLDRYGHLMPGNEAEATALLDAYLAEAKSLPISGRRG